MRKFHCPPVGVQVLIGQGCRLHARPFGLTFPPAILLNFSFIYRSDASHPLAEVKRMLYMRPVMEGSGK